MSNKNAPAIYHSPAMIDAALGPAMRALNDRQKAFVDYVVTTGTKNFTEAARAVGYSEHMPTSYQQAHAMRHSQAITDAIIEEGKRRVNMHLPMALQTAIQIAGDPSHKDALKAALALMAMSGVSPVTLSKTETHVVHHGTPLENIEARLAVLPPDVANLLRQQLLPPRMIDITPTLAEVVPLPAGDTRVAPSVIGEVVGATPSDEEILADLRGFL